MADPYMAELRIMAFVVVPKGWAQANGQLLPINQNQALFSLLGTNYGGDGRVNFALPDLRGQVPIHYGNGHTLGERGGEESHTLSSAELPAHTHAVTAVSDNGTAIIPTGNLLGGSANQAYITPNNLTAMNAASIASTGGSQSHENRQPLLALNFCIALQGIFPSQS